MVVHGSGISVSIAPVSRAGIHDAERGFVGIKPGGERHELESHNDFNSYLPPPS